MPPEQCGEAVEIAVACASRLSARTWPIRVRRVNDARDRVPNSEESFDPELHLASRESTKDAAKVRGERRAVRHIEVGVIQQVEDFPPELQPCALGKGDIPLESDVDVRVAG